MNGGQALSLVFYQDEIKPGNILRPDVGRSLVCFYWTILELPSWFRARQHGWFHFGVFPLWLMDKLPGGHSFLFVFMLKTFFGKGNLKWDFSSTGVCCKTTSQDVLVFGRFSTLLADEKALVQLWCTKGASSYKPCHLCKNVMGRQGAPPEHSYLIPYTCTDAKRFDLHSPESFENMVQMLKLAAADHDKKRFQKLEQAYGLVYNPLGAPWCPELRGICNAVSGTCWDWMHILMASGGVAQYEFNQYIRRLCKATGLKPKSLDDFASQVVWPQKAAPWPKTYFQKRVVDEDDAHLKAFASELFQLMDILNLLICVVVRPANALQEETACLECMMDIIFFLSLQEKTLLHVGALDKAICKHHHMFLALYPECNKPKTHWLRHIPQQLHTLQCNLSCFSPERKHKGVKVLASKVFVNVDRGVFYRAVAEDVKGFCNDEHAVAPVFLERPRLLSDGAPWLRTLFPDMQDGRGSKTLRFEGGYIQQRDLVWFPAHNVLAQAEMFLQIQTLSCSQFLILGSLFREDAARQNIFTPTQEKRVFPCSPDLLAISFCDRAGGIFPCTRLACT